MEAVNKCDMYDHLLDWKLELQIETQQSSPGALGGGGSRSGWELPVPAAIQGQDKWVVGPYSVSLV